MLRWIYDAADLFLLVEFDVNDDLMGRSYDDSERFDFLVKKFERGCEEYDASKMLVVNGFLAPVFCLNFTSANNEISLKRWRNLLEAAGFDRISAKHVYDYW